MATLAMWTPGPMEMGIILVLGLLLFGKRLPEVGRSIGKGIVEFKRGLKDIGDEIETESNHPGTPKRNIEADAGVKLDPPTSREGDEVRVSRTDHVD